MALSRYAALAALALGLGGCSVGPDFIAPKAEVAQDWQDPSARGSAASHVTTRTDPDPQWWSGFGDPVLTELETRAISGNLDLQQAMLRVIEARQNEVGARAAGLPSLNGTASYTRQQLGLRGILESQGAYSQLNRLADQSATVGGTSVNGGQLRDAVNGLTQPVDLFQYGLDASWQLDLFGQVRRSGEQARAATEAQVEATNDALVMLEGEVASTYMQVRGAQALLESQKRNVAVASNSFSLTQRQQRQGLSTQLDVEQARTQLATFEAQLPGYEKQAQQAMNQLSVLTGQPPGALDALLATGAPMPKAPDVIGVGVPASLARRRPDIRQAEARLHAATANVGVAVASFYPDISLTGNFGLRALDASYLTNWASAFYAFGPSISLPIFQGGRLTSNLRTARAQEAEAALNYRSTVLNALREVENALVAYRTDHATRDKLAQTIRSGEQSVYLASDSYQHGLTSFFQVLDAERTLVASRQQLIQAEVTLTNDVVALYNALGGGWQQTQIMVNAPQIDMSTPFTPAAADRLAASIPPDQGSSR